MLVVVVVPLLDPDLGAAWPHPASTTSDNRAPPSPQTVRDPDSDLPLKPTLPSLRQVHGPRRLLLRRTPDFCPPLLEACEVGGVALGRRVTATEWFEGGSRGPSHRPEH